MSVKQQSKHDLAVALGMELAREKVGCWMRS